MNQKSILIHSINDDDDLQCNHYTMLDSQVNNKTRKIMLIIIRTNNMLYHFVVVCNDDDDLLEILDMHALYDSSHVKKQMENI